ncbi:hypothetical protein [Carnobacterium maltaromaticum]|uniref:hypothetical protein n=1 Tax=Carnobacterium maltaromaticum TaxID=2751 RepID=UPI0039BDB115
MMELLRIRGIFLLSARVERLNELFIRPALMSQLLEKKIKIRGGKKRPINFPYSSIEPERTQQAFNRANQLNELFIRPALMSQLLEKKIKI